MSDWAGFNSFKMLLRTPPLSPLLLLPFLFEVDFVWFGALL